MASKIKEEFIQDLWGTATQGILMSNPLKRLYSLPSHQEKEHIALNCVTIIEAELQKPSGLLFSDTWTLNKRG